MSARTLRKHARAIFDAALAAADPSRAVERHLARIDFDRFRNIYVLGAGKAGASMARTTERILGRRITAGLVNVKYGHTARLRRIELNECGHPEPDERGMNGAGRIAALAAQAERDDLVLCLISGGASALLPLPAPPVTLEEKRDLTRLLLEAGADIHEMNTVRKHLSRIKGGELARLAAPARVESLLLSDVVGDNPDVIGSGPTAADASTFADAAAVLKRYGIWRRAPKAIRARIESGLCGEIPETPKPGDAAFRRVRNTVIGSNRLALTAAAGRARELGYRTLILSSQIVGETREVARMHAAMLREAALTGQPVKPPACIISGGETTVTLNGGGRDGQGGRNQEFALAAAIDMAGLPDALVFSAGTDGTDGPTDAAGAMADSVTLARNPEARRYLDNHDSYHYFEILNDLVKTGPTHTNVMDVRIMLIGGAAMSFWRSEVIDFALDNETRLHMDEQREWIAREPSNAKPYYALSQFYRIGGKADYALALMLEAVRLDPEFAEAHASLCEEYAIRADYPAAWRHARLAEQNGQVRGVELLTRYQVPEAPERGIS